MRLFAGIELDDATRAVCAGVAHRLALAAFEARYDAPEKFHVTLAFLGNVRDEQLEDVEHALEGTAKNRLPFEITWDRVGAFPNERRPRIAFVGSRTQGDSYRSLAHLLRQRFRAVGFEFKEDPVAHVTLARIKGGSARPLPMLDLAPHVMPVHEIALFESLPAGTTTRYEIRRRAPFAGLTSLSGGQLDE